MGMSRRSLFRAGTMAGLAASLPLGSRLFAGTKPTPKPQPPVRGGDDSLPYLSFADFSDHVGTPLVLRRKMGTLTLQLIAVKDLAGAPAPARSDPALQGEVFALTFSGPAEVALRQDVYDFEHPRLGAFSLLLVPAGLSADGVRLYTAIINRRMP